MSRSFAYLILAAAALMVAVPTAHAGAVFEIKEAVDVPDEAFKFFFNAVDQNVNKKVGSIVRSNVKGAGKVFEDSAIPLTIFTLNQCTAVAPHHHPNAAETLFVLKGKIRITQFQENMMVRVTEVEEGSAGYLQQGTIHTVENIAKGTTKFLQIFDHPFAGAVFASVALDNLPQNVVNSAFSEDVLDKNIMGLGGIIAVRQCQFHY